jgi:NAD(P)-dependent dehydrogenase (short-subunit alcohol dehydrogenase family)
VVTGAAGGIGSDTCSLLIARGWTVIGVDRDADALAEVAARLPQLIPVTGDVRDPATAAAARAAAENAGPLTAWVNNAAVLRPRPLHEAEAAFVEEQLAINLTSVVLGCHEALASFVEGGVAGAIVNVTSIHAQHPFPGLPLYAAAKGGVEALTRQLCVEYGERGIRVNAVAPGAVRTPMTLGDGDPEEALRSAAALSPMRRVSESSEIASAIAFLLSSEAAGINGHVLAVDNGMSAQGRSL